MNERTVLEGVRQLAPVSRAQIARASGLSKPTVSQALASLERANLVREAGRSSGGKGPTALLYEVNPVAGFVVALDVGPSKVRAAVADLTGEIVAQRLARTASRSASALISQLGELARQTVDDARLGWRRVVFACIGSPGVLQPGQDRLRLAHNLPGWERQGVMDAVQRELGCQVAFENDVNLATLGEQRLGLGKEVLNYVYLHIGTGVGMGLVLNGELYRGSSGAAGEVGYLPVAVEDTGDPASRRRGALESVLSANAVMEQAVRDGVPEVTDARDVFEAARRGDAAARPVIAAVSARIALAIASTAAVIDPELVIIGGPIGRQGDLLLEPVERELAARSPFRPRIEASALGDDAEIHGAIARALDSAQDLLFDRIRRHAPNSPRAPTNRSASPAGAERPDVEGGTG
jgi:predicted NBD/HSP70 family sugar kinase